MIDRVYLLLLITLLVTASERRTGLMVPTVRPWNDTSSCVLRLTSSHGIFEGIGSCVWMAEVKWFFPNGSTENSTRVYFRLHASPLSTNNEKRKSKAIHTTNQNTFVALIYNSRHNNCGLPQKFATALHKGIEIFAFPGFSETVSFRCNLKDYRSRNSVLMSIKLWIVKSVVKLTI